MSGVLVFILFVFIFLSAMAFIAFKNIINFATSGISVSNKPYTPKRGLTISL